MACCLSYGQKVAVVRNSVPYMEWLGGKPEVDDRDMRLCLAFDEDRNTLTVSLNSTNSLLFAFPRGVLYDNAFHGGNKLKAEHLANGSGLLKAEMRTLDGLILRCGEASRVPAGGALAVDRDVFSERITRTLREHPLVTFESRLVDAIPEGPVEEVYD